MFKGFPGFSFEQHQITGQQMHNAREYFGNLHIALAKSYGESAKPARLVEDVINTIDRLRNSLVEVGCTENPDREVSELNRCYYTVSE